MRVVSARRLPACAGWGLPGRVHGEVDGRRPPAGCGSGEDGCTRHRQRNHRDCRVHEPRNGEGELPVELWQRIVGELAGIGPEGAELVDGCKLQRLIRVSAVSSVLTAAAAGVLAHSGTLSLSGTGLPGRLDSSLLLGWAPMIDSLRMSSDSYSLPGMAAFLQAACNLESLELDSPDLISCAQADHMLQLCSQVQHVRLQGGCSHLPSHFPASLATLDVSLHSGGLDFDVQQPSALIWRLAQHMNLDHLSLDYGGTCPCVLLASPVQLQRLRVWLCFRISCGMGYDLSWLRHQPVSRLELEIHVRTTEHAAHEKATSELQHVPISSLTLFVYKALPPAVQALWKAVTVKADCTVNIMSQFFQDMGTTITALPRCSCRRLFLQAGASKTPSSVSTWIGQP